MGSWWTRFWRWVHRLRFERALRRMTRDGRRHGMVVLDAKGLPDWASAPPLSQRPIGYVEEVLGEDELAQPVVTIRIGGRHG